MEHDGPQHRAASENPPQILSTSYRQNLVL